MRFSKRQLVLAAVLALAMLAVAVDRIILTDSTTGPAQAGAAVADAPEISPPGAATADGRVAAPSAASSRGETLTKRLDRLGDSEQLQLAEVPDAFKPSQLWLMQSTAHRDRVAQPDLAQRFADTHQLCAVMMGAGGGKAVVGDRCLTVGQQLDGFRLQSVSPAAAVFEYDGQRVRLELQPQPPGQ